MEKVFGEAFQVTLERTDENSKTIGVDLLCSLLASFVLDFKADREI